MTRYKVTRRDGYVRTITNNKSLSEMNSWKRAYNRNYANGRRGPKSEGISSIKVMRKKRRNQASWFEGFDIGI